MSSDKYLKRGILPSNKFFTIFNSSRFLLWISWNLPTFMEIIFKICFFTDCQMHIQFYRQRPSHLCWVSANGFGELWVMWGFFCIDNLYLLYTNSGPPTDNQDTTGTRTAPFAHLYWQSLTPQPPLHPSSSPPKTVASIPIWHVNILSTKSVWSAHVWTCYVCLTSDETKTSYHSFFSFLEYLVLCSAYLESFEGWLKNHLCQEHCSFVQALWAHCLGGKYAT